MTHTPPSGEPADSRDERAREAEMTATRTLVDLGLEMVRAGAPGMREADVEAWLLSENELPLPPSLPQPPSGQS